MFIHVQAVQRDNFAGAWRAGRFWPSGQALRVEVLGQDEDPAPVVEDVLDQNGRKLGTREVPSMKQIGRKTYATIKADARLRILSDNETQELAAAEELASVRKVSDELAKENAALRAKVAELEGLLGAATAPAAPAAPPAPAGDAKPDKGGKK